MLQDCLTLFSVQSQGMTTEYHQREIPYRDKEQCHCYTFFHTLGVQFKNNVVFSKVLVHECRVVVQATLLVKLTIHC